MKNVFSRLMYELGEELEVDLEPDVLNSCTISIEEKISLQFELDSRKDQLILACIIAVVPPGKFRENVLLTALKANNIYPRAGVLGFLDTTSELILFHYFPLEDLKGKEISTYLGLFLDEVTLWQSAIESGILTSIMEDVNK